ncbi:MAG: hypothetical protein LUQ04_10625 [Methanoregula sp.]|nr:hypothetical protein [Methanoregula sp.]
MGRVALHFSEEDYKLFHHYCTNYCRLYDETRKNSIKILLELYKHQVIDIQEHSLDNIFTFFYQKKQEFETDCRAPGSGANELMRMRMCSDSISFLEDLEKIYLILRKKGLEANYLLILGSFSKIIDEEYQMRLEELHEAASGAINAIVSPLGDAMEKKLGSDVDIQDLLYELVNYTNIFNRLSTDLSFNDEIIDLITPSLFKRFGKKENYEEIRAFLKEYRDQFEVDELESALEGGLHAQNVWGLEFSWRELLEPLHTLNELIAESQSRMWVSLDVLSALEAPMKGKPAQAEYSQLIPYQKPYRELRRRNEVNRFLVKVDNRSRSEVQLSTFSDFIPQVHSQGDKYKRYFSITAGAMALLILILAIVILSVSSAPSIPVGNTTDGLLGTKNATIAASATLKTTKPAPTPIPTPTPTPQYVTIEPVIREPDTSPKSTRELFGNPNFFPNILFNPKDYITIFKNNLSYNLDNSYKISFDLKNPPMVIRYKVYPNNITDTKWFEPRDAKKKIDTATINRPDEFAWFELKIYDDEGLYDQQGWGRLYGNPLTMQEIYIRNGGLYQIEFSGQLVTVSSEVLVKKEGNIMV